MGDLATYTFSGDCFLVALTIFMLIAILDYSFCREHFIKEV